MKRNATVKPALALTIVVALSLVTAFSAVALAGTKTGIALGALAALGPVTVYCALVAPLIFPFTGFIVLTPFDNLLAVSAFGTLTRMSAIVTGAAMLLYFARTRAYVLPSRALVAWCAFFAWSLASTLWSIDAPSAFEALATLLQLFLLYTAVSFMPVRENVLRIVIAATIASATVAGLYGAYVFHNGQTTHSGLVTGRLFLGNDSTIIDPNQFAASMLTPLLIALVGGVYARTWLARVAFFSCVLLMGTGITISASRGAAISLIVAVLYLLIRSRKRIVLGITAFVGAAVALISHGNILARFSDAASSGGAGRADIWRVGLVAFREHWLVGAGIGNFPFAFDQAFLRVQEAYYTHWHRASHNILIQTAVELGIVGIVLFGYAWWTQVRSLRVIPVQSGLYPLRLALEAGIVGLFVSGFFLNIMTEKYLWLALMLVALTRNTYRYELRKSATA